ncbi:MFS transporter [Homoserinimonas aerilata]|uniref:MFS transporter n=1 Tax=Homoserinimonas aerilata TaxID=1162970 RepID=A0A542YGU6_9MICO|nr:MFS transporter [Homoserinimonas aerilata]TQL47271.1 MFS transporter [Homoserinimonas aerilata]
MTSSIDRADPDGIEAAGDATEGLATPSPFAEPTKAVTGAWIALFATAWLGVWMAQLTPIQLLLPVQIEAQLGASSWIDNVVAFGIVSGIAGLCAVVAYPVTGALSDRTVSRFGRRRPWVAAGALLFSGSLLLLGAQESMIGIGVFWSLALVGFCMLTAALTATISDQVPVGQRGFVSGWISAPQAVGTILGLILVTELFVGQFVGYAVMSALLVLLVLPFLLRVGDEVLPAADRPPLTLRGLVQGFWISPTLFPDFGWTLLSRVLINVGNALGTSMLLYFLAFGLGLGIVEAEGSLIVLTLVYMVFVIVASLVFGRLSDRVGRRRLFVFIAGALQAIAALMLALIPELSVAMVAAAILGLGYGTFLSVDQALATQVLPDAQSRGKDLGIMNIAWAVPQAISPLLGAWVVAWLAGFQGLFLLAAAAGLLGALAVLFVKGVR